MPNKTLTDADILAEYSDSDIVDYCRAREQAARELVTAQLALTRAQDAVDRAEAEVAAWIADMRQELATNGS